MNTLDQGGQSRSCTDRLRAGVMWLGMRRVMRQSPDLDGNENFRRSSNPLLSRYGVAKLQNTKNFVCLQLPVVLFVRFCFVGGDNTKTLMNDADAQYQSNQPRTLDFSCARQNLASASQIKTLRRTSASKGPYLFTSGLPVSGC